MITADSLVLVSLINKIPSLAPADSTWFNGNVSTWTGVSVVGNRVTGLQLDSRVVSGDSIPSEFCDLTALDFLSINYCQFVGLVPACLINNSTIRYLGISNNQLTGIAPGADFTQLTAIFYIGISNNQFQDMPDFLSITSPDFSALDVRNNHFNFDDLLPLLSRTGLNYTYFEQYDASSYQQFYVQVSDSADFPDASLIAGGTGNTYNWRVLGGGDSSFTPSPARFRNVNGPVLRVEGAELSDHKLYDCQMTNPNLPGLVLKTGHIFMGVNDLLPQSITYTGDTLVYCRDLPRLSATAAGGRPVTFTSLNDSIATIRPDTILTMHSTGIARILATTPADSMYHSDSLVIEITVDTHLIIPGFDITEQLPTSEDPNLALSVPFIPALVYRWTTPSGFIGDSCVLDVTPFTASDEGIYQLRVTEGTCFHRSLSVTINGLLYGKPVIYELITPNGDGDNETFYIENLNPSVSNEVSIFNAVHQVVYHQENYRNEWDGGALPVGTYYYIVKLDHKTYKGNLYIKR